MKDFSGPQGLGARPSVDFKSLQSFSPFSAGRAFWLNQPDASLQRLDQSEHRRRMWKAGE